MLENVLSLKNKKALQTLLKLIAFGNQLAVSRKFNQITCKFKGLMLFLKALPCGEHYNDVRLASIHPVCSFYESVSIQ